VVGSNLEPADRWPHDFANALGCGCCFLRFGLSDDALAHGFNTYSGVNCRAGIWSARRRRSRDRRLRASSYVDHGHARALSLALLGPPHPRRLRAALETHAARPSHFFSCRLDRAAPFTLARSISRRRSCFFTYLLDTDARAPLSQRRDPFRVGVRGPTYAILAISRRRTAWRRRGVHFQRTFDRPPATPSHRPDVASGPVIQTTVSYIEPGFHRYRRGVSSAHPTFGTLPHNA